MVNDLVISHKVGSINIGQRVGDGYINATAMCKANGKLVGHYMENDTTKDFMAALSSDIGIPISELVQIRKGGIVDQQGTWVHPDVAVNLGQWCSPLFAVLVSRWVREWLTMGRTPNEPPRNPVYTKRLSLTWKMQLTVPDGYWTVFNESSSLLILVECDLKLPVERFDLLDGSVGIRYSAHRKGEAWAGQSITYEHIFPDKRGTQRALAYPLEELPFFKRFLRGIYIPEYLPAYLESKYDMPVPASALIDRALGVVRISGPN